MKKLLFGIGILFLFIASSSVAYAEINLKFKTISYPKYWSFYGQSLNVEKVTYTGKKFIDQKTGKYVYGYKVIVRRPSKDNGWGVINDGMNHRIFYWAAHDGWNLRIAISNNMGIYQDETPDNPRYITLYITLGLAPQTHRIRIAAIPYPMFSNTGSFRGVIQLARNNYISWAKDLLTATTPQGFVGSIAWGAAKNVTFDSLIAAISTEFGQIIEFDVPVIMPKITTRYEDEAKNLLKQHDLYPNPNYQIVDQTTDRRLHKRISRQQFKVNSLVRPGSNVAYKFWKWDGDTQIQPVKTSQKPPICGTWKLDITNSKTGTIVKRKMTIKPLNGSDGLHVIPFLNGIKGIGFHTGMTYSNNASFSHEWIVERSNRAMTRKLKIKIIGNELTGELIDRMEYYSGKGNYTDRYDISGSK